MKIIIGGQSNGYMLRDTPEISEFSQALGATISYSAFGGSALLKENRSSSSVADPNNYWLEDDYSEGPRMSEALSNVILNGQADYMVWVHGEQEATRVTSAQQVARYKEGQFRLMNQFRLFNPNMKFLICRIGQRLNANKDLGISLIQQAQTEIIQSVDDAYLGADCYDLDLQDHVHYSEKGRQELLARVQKNIQLLEINKQPLEGPYVIGAKAKSSDRTKVLVDLGNVSKLYMGSTSQDLLTVQGSTQLTLLSRVKIFDDVIQLNFDGPITDHKLTIAYGRFPEIDDSGGKQIRNENLLPIRPQTIDITSGNWG